MSIYPHPSPLPDGRGGFGKHEAHEDHEAVWAYGAKYLFCKANLPTKQIFEGAFWCFCLMLPHNPHVFSSNKAFVYTYIGKSVKFMRIMRIYEEGLFNGFYLPCIWRRPQAPQKHEAVMRQHEADPHVLPPSPFGHFPQIGKVSNLGEEVSRLT